MLHPRKMESDTGIEPVHRRVASSCLPTWPIRHEKLVESPGVEPRPDRVKACGATITPRIREGGAHRGIRTLDIHLGKVALYQLSYVRMTETGDPTGIRTRATTVKGW